MMKKLLLSLGVILCGVVSAAERVVIWPDINTCRDAESPATAKKRVELGRGVSVNLDFEITTKGNGALALPALGVRVYDSHDDGLIFRDGLLKCEWLDLDGDGIFELVTSGVALVTDDKTGAVKKAVPVRGVFRYRVKERRFEVKECSLEIYYFKIES